MTAHDTAPAAHEAGPATAQGTRRALTTTVELCAGIGGFSSPHTHALALVEKEPTCRAILRRHHPYALILDDVLTSGACNLPMHPTILKFGFPCQDLSVAGKRAGLAGARSGLFFECMRNADELRPDIIVWENVPGLLSSNAGRDFLAVLTELDRLGFAGGWTTVDAQFFGVAQRRQRVFGVFARRHLGAARCAEILSLAARLPWNLTTGRKTRQSVAGTIAAGAHPGSYNGQDAYTGMLTPVSARSASHGGADDNDAQAGHLVAYALNSHAGAADADVSNRSHANGGPTALGVSENLAFTLRGGRTQNAGGTFGVRRLTPTECERLQGFPDGYTAWGIDEQGNRVEMSDSVRYRMLGNAVCKRVSDWIDSQIVKYL